VSTRLEGKVALVTGATGNLGSALARRFAAEGADLVITSRTRARLDEVADDIRQETGRRVEVRPADLSIAADAERVGTEAWEAFGGLDIVLVGAVPPEDDLWAGDVLTTDDDLWASMHELIVWGPLRMLRVIAPKMMERERGSILTIVSATASMPTPGYDAYGLAKGSLLLLTKYMAKEWGPRNVRVNAINPGAIATHDNEAELTAQANKTRVFERIAMGRVGQAREFIDAAVFLVSDEASFVSGQLLSVDGARF
jgi:NAD(P)-dependent dehydrogenase (short-subunit alcohol dehydrogenase family)